MDCALLLIADRRALSTAGPNIVGWKADGIAKLPTGWVPSFFVITTVAYQKWREANGMGDEADTWPIDSVLTESILRQTAPIKAKILVRSSGVAEGFEARGRFDSRESAATAEALKEAAFYVWRRALKDASDQEPPNEDET